ncbi:hypothetical protein L3X38_038196 [Prunus dulcis]|uniref:Ubiquitin-like protease family profile domain-containing protein n=1 Tax=Prunus dulcis TaxID=3755 RepID=A0AAD4YRY7_PRUDU|nr:hypothetical protein L3X38_038196 [Prunus dulcis]
MLLGDDIGKSPEGTKVEFTPEDIDLDQPTAVLSQLNVWLNDEGKAVEQGVQLWKRKRIIPNVPARGMSWENAYKVYAPCMLTKYKHWVALMIDLVKCEIKVYDSMVSLIPDEILKEDLAPLSITIPNLLNTMDFYEKGFYANDCSIDWWCPWPIKRVDVPQQSNQ